jgi:hypothetical protein
VHVDARIFKQLAEVLTRFLVPGGQEPSFGLHKRYPGT